MKILVTGGAGYIGLHAVKELRRQGHEPVIFDNATTGNLDMAQGEKLYVGDLLDPHALQGVFTQHRFDAVMHFAAVASVPESVEKPLFYYQQNLKGSIKLLEMMQKMGVHKFIFSSSAAVYGIAQDNPISEEHPCQPINPYGRSKLMVEKILDDLHQAGQMDYISFRYFNAAGADPHGEIGERHKEEHHLIPRILQEALRAKKRGETPKASVYGNDYPTPDGTCIRDYVHVADIAQAHILGMQTLSKNPMGRIYNLGNQHGVSVMEIIRACEKITGCTIESQILPKRAGDPPILIASQIRVRKELGWKQQFPDIEKIIETAWLWEQKQSLS